MRRGREGAEEGAVMVRRAYHARPRTTSAPAVGAPGLAARRRPCLAVGRVLRGGWVCCWRQPGEPHHASAPALGRGRAHVGIRAWARMYPGVVDARREHVVAPLAGDE